MISLLIASKYISENSSLANNAKVSARNKRKSMLRPSQIYYAFVGVTSTIIVRSEVFCSCLSIIASNEHCTGLCMARFGPIQTAVRLSTSQGTINVFSKAVKRIQRNRASVGNTPGVYDYLKDTVANEVVDRVCDIAR